MTPVTDHDSRDVGTSRHRENLAVQYQLFARVGIHWAAFSE